MLVAAVTFLFVATAAPEAAPSLSPRAITLIAPVHEAYERVEQAQSRLAPPSSPAEKLERLLDLDQAGRGALPRVDIATLPLTEQKPASEAVWAEIRRHDLEDQAALKRLIPEDGWFKESVYGEKATRSAFLIVQHATNDMPLMRRTLMKIGEYVKTGDAKGGMYALMYDRVALEFDHKPQRYGSQVNCVSGVWTPINLEDPSNVDLRRKQIGLATTEAEYLTHFKDDPCH